MKKIVFLLASLILTLTSCTKEEENLLVTINFTHYWDGIEITNQDFNQLKFTNANGEKLSIERFRYLISNIGLIGAKNYFLVDLGEGSATAITISDLNAGTHNLNFTFGFSDDDNTDGIYQDLNSASFNVPGMLGGGYHYMQFDGKYINTNDQEAGFNYHTIRAVNKTDPDNLVFKDTSFKVDLGTITIQDNTTIDIKVNIAEWFKNPNTWNLNELNQTLMPNFDAQVLMNANGKSVFSLGKVTQ